MENIVIVGGGTSGWMAAIALSSHLPDKQITVIDPSSVAPIGVGESVTGTILQFVRYPFHELSTTDFFQSSDATLKLGIWFKDWMAPGTEYLSPIDFPPDVFDHHYYEDMEDFYALMTANGKSVCEEQTHGRLMRSNLTDYFRDKAGNVSGQYSTSSCHMDSLKFGAWLKKEACQRKNIKHIDKVIEGFEQDSKSGFVTEIITNGGERIKGDFFVDCTGFRRLLFKPAYSPKWVDFSKFIKVDSAIPSFSSHKDDQKIPVYTQSRALNHGWMWQIPTQSRLGHGYVFSSKYVSDEEAIAEQRAHGFPIEDDARVIRFEPGKFETQWQGNVCAIGMAGGFIEPLESTTIHIVDVQIKALTELLLPYFNAESAPSLSKKYNSMMSGMYDDFVDFVSFHYRTGRSDTEFWRDYQRDESITDANKERLELWQHSFPAREDFRGIQTNRMILAAGIVVWMPMLCGMGILDKDLARVLLDRAKTMSPAISNYNKYISIRDHICSNAVSQREAVRHLRGDSG